MEWVFSYGAPILSFVFTAGVLALLVHRFSDRILDYPNERSLHRHPVPRMGGIGITAGLIASIPIVSPTEWWPLWCGLLLVIGVSFLDDLVGLPVIGRLVAHFVATGIAVDGLFPSTRGVALAGVIIVAIVWMTNLYNFMDGMDGLAGGMAVFGFGAFTIAAWHSGVVPLALVSLSVASAAGAFLYFNFHPARIFLGDAGSTALGFLAGGLALIGWESEVWSLWLPLMAFSPFIVDATVTLVRRALNGEKLWHAHRKHFYQRLILLGWGHRKTALMEYLTMGVCGVFALGYQVGDEITRVIIFLCWVGLMTAIMAAVSGLERANNHADVKV